MVSCLYLLGTASLPSPDDHLTASRESCRRELTMAFRSPTDSTGRSSSTTTAVRPRENDDGVDDRTALEDPGPYAILENLILAALVHQHHAPDLVVRISPSAQSKALSRAAMRQGKRKEQYDASTKKVKEEDGYLVAIELVNAKAKVRIRLLSRPC
jgi:hypothetical protein